MNAFLSLLASDLPALFDGATGTELYKRGIFINRCFEEANLSARTLVLDLHREYARSGARILTTNSWGANRYKLATHNLAPEAGRINLEAARIAREAADTAPSPCIVAGSVGPLGARLAPFGRITADEAAAAFREHVQGLARGGADLILLETFYDAEEAEIALCAALDAAPDLPVAACLTVDLAGRLASGPSLEEAFARLAARGATALGLNCSVGPQPLLTAVRHLRTTTTLPLIVQPNAGLPKEVDGRTIYMSTPEYFATWTRYLLQEGVALVGGCCGTSPAHIKAMSAAIRQYRAMDRSSGTSNVAVSTLPGVPSSASQDLPAPALGATAAASLSQPTTPLPDRVSVTHTSTRTAQDADLVPFAQKSAWSAKLARGETVASVELLPPAGTDTTSLIARAREARAAGIDAINIPDGPRASSRMSTIVSAIMIERDARIETILHYTCRDRNLIGMQSDMLGAHAIGLRNILAVTGDPPKLGDYPDATGVFDIDSVGLVAMMRRLDSGYDVGGRPIAGPTSLSRGVGVNPVHRDFEYEMARFRSKVESGAEWAITQPVFDPRAMERLLSWMEKNGLHIPVVMGVWPLTSLRNALFMRNEVPGIEIPDEVVGRMEKAATPQAARDEGVSIAGELAMIFRGSVGGFQLSAPFGKLELALRVLERLR